jgi:aspartokinase
MQTIKDVCFQIIEDNPDLKEIFLSPHVNISSLAKEIKPKVEEILFKKVNLISIILSLKRIKEGIKPKKIKIYQSLPDILIKNNVVEAIFDLKDENLKKAFIEKIFKQSYAFVKEAYEITVIFDRLKWNQMKLDIKPKKIILDLDVVHIILPEESIYVPGLYYHFLKAIQSKEISLVEIFSSYTELSFVVFQKDSEMVIKMIRNTLRKLIDI